MNRKRLASDVSMIARTPMKFSYGFKALMLAGLGPLALLSASHIAVAADLAGAGGTGNGFGSANSPPSQGNGGVGYSSSAAAGGQGGTRGGTSISSGDMTGGAGGTGNNAVYPGSGPAVQGGGGGGGGAGVYLNGGTHTTNSGQTIRGGAGGAGGTVSGGLELSDAYAGSGGGGGAGAVLNGGTLTNAAGASIVGGNGGAAGNAGSTGNRYVGGPGGGGDGVVVQEGGRFENYGSATGGDGLRDGYSGNGGAGIRVGDNGYVVNGGVVKAGTSYGDTPTNAIEIVGNNGTLELRRTSDIQGNVVVANGKTGNNLALGGTDGTSFAVSEIGSKYVGFDGYKKVGTGTWSLTGTTTQNTPWTIEGGVLQISQDASLGSASSNLTLNGGTLQTTAGMDMSRNIVLGANNGTLLTSGGTVTANGVISGAGGLTKAGGSTLVLTRDNTYTGGTTVTGGRLALGNGGTTGSVKGNIALTGGDLEINRSNSIVLDNTISGTGALYQTGTGTTIITGENTYTGQTDIQAGTLQVGNGGTTGSINGTSGVNVAQGAALAMNRSDNVVFNPVVSGAGSLRQVGTGTTTLTGENTYTGQTDIQAGTLQLGNGGTTGSINATSGLNVGSGGTLAFNRSDDLTFSNVVSGDGSIRKLNANRLNLTGDSSAFTGSTFVQSGNLAINGSLGGLVDVGNGATLSGNGTAGNVILRAGSTVAPGNSVGTLNTSGNFQQMAGSTYQVEIDTVKGTNDLIAVQGSAQIDNGAGINVRNVGGASYELDRRYKVLSATDGVTGKYTLTGDTAISLFYRLEDQYDSNNVYLTAQQFRQFDELGETPNQRGVGKGLQSLKTPPGTPPNPLFRAIAMLPDLGSAQYAFDQLSGEIYGSTKTGLIEDSRYVREATTQRLRTACDDGNPGRAMDMKCGTSMWTQGFGSWSRIAGDGSAAQLDHNIGGLLLGVDTPVSDHVRAGVLAGYSRSSFKVNDRQSSAKSDNYELGVYGGGLWGRLGVNMGMNYTWHRVDTDRTVAFGTFREDLNSKYKANTFQVYSDVSYKMDAGQGSVEPFANLAYVKLNRDGYNEDGGYAALNSSKEKNGVTFSTLGLRAKAPFSVGRTSMAAEATLGWRHAFGSRNISEVTHAFTGGSDFSATGVRLPEDVALVKAGLTSQVGEKVSVGLSYIGQFGSGLKENGLVGNVSVRF